MNKNIILGILVVLILIGVMGIIFLMSPWLTINLGGIFQQNPSKPEKTYGEFPFRLEYEIDEKIIIVEDKLICKYDGIGFNEGQGKTRKWKSYLESGNEKILLLKIDETQEIYFDPGSAWYYMGDGDESGFYHTFPNAWETKKINNITSKRIISADELWVEHKIRLIDWQYTQPIQNSFKQ